MRFRPIFGTQLRFSGLCIQSGGEASRNPLAPSQTALAAENDVNGNNNERSMYQPIPHPNRASARRHQTNAYLMSHDGFHRDSPWRSELKSWIGPVGIKSVRSGHSWQVLSFWLFRRSRPELRDGLQPEAIEGMYLHFHKFFHC